MDLIDHMVSNFKTEEYYAPVEEFINREYSKWKTAAPGSPERIEIHS